MSVKVGVRVRPFNKRQQQLGCKCCVDMNGSTTHIKDPNYNDVKSFVFDYSFWSHDKFTIDTDGIYRPIDDKYADQEKVYGQIGSDILVNAWQGYNCCLFAYGQTGSGKSYSMLGYGINRGIIPMVCDNIFLKIAQDKNSAHSYQVKVSMMEIYNETLRDLLTKSKKSQQLKICQSKKLGVYVEGLIKHPVNSYEEIDKKIEEGSNNRSIAATLMNQSSSRSHTIVSITFVKKIQMSAAQTSVKYSTIHLVDLAGSQSVGKTGVDSKDRLRQAAKINQSLSTLGRVIQILAQNSARMDKLFVPYRDSKLTFILRNALGGNSRTAMICAISPADDNYQQTVSTLRYAQRAKKIQNKAIVNQSDIDKLVRMLKQQNQMLKKMLQQAKYNKTIINTQIISNIIQTNKNMAALGVIPDDQLMLDDNQSIGSRDNQDTSFNQNNLSMLDYIQKIDQKQPYITNLSQDQLLSGRLKYSCSKILRIGNKQGIPKPDVVLAALGILPIHCQIRNDNGKIFIQVFDQQASQYTFINGQNVQKDHEIQLMNFDRLIFGTGCIFLVKIPQGQIRKGKKDKQIKPQDIDYTYAIAQMQQHQVSGGLIDKNQKVNQAQQQQIRKKVLQQIQQSYIKMKQQNLNQLKNKLIQQQKQYQQKISQIQKIRLQQAKKLKQQLQRKSAQTTKLKSDKQKVQQQIQHYRELQKKLQQTSIDKQALQQARNALQQKIKTINQLQTSLLSIQSKQQQMITQMQKKQVIIQKQLQFKMVMCNNQNILNQYKLQLSKKTKNIVQLKQLLIKKQKIQMQKQLIQLVPMIQKFNLIAREMGKNIQSGLSIDYSYISQGQALEILKNNSYKNKIKISIHVFNRQEKRSYFWTVEVFKNRYQFAISMFQVFIRNQKDPQLNNKETDPYWDPPTPLLLGITFLSIQFLFYKLDFQGDISIVKKGDKVGKLHVKIYPTDAKRTINISQQTKNGITIYNPRQFIQKTLCFCIQLSDLKLQREYMYTKVQIQYTLIQSSYKNLTLQTEFMPPNQFKYSNFHILADLSETVIVQYVDQPLAFRIIGEHKQIVDQDDDLTVRNEDMYDSPEKSQKSVKGSIKSVKGSFADTRSIGSNQDITRYSTPTNPTTPNMKKQPAQSNGHSGIIVSNFDVMSKIEQEYNKQKQQKIKKQKQKQKQKQTKKDDKKGKGKGGKDDCNIF